ncbi:MAG: T9SS type B sorting domain-containing protein [Bacteroidales bacterium]|nr:T9SS type B sorting domain-containing protein [Bacteroidales bacterium]
MKKFNNNNDFDKFFRDELYYLEKEPPISVFDKLSKTFPSSPKTGISKKWFWLGGFSIALFVVLFTINTFNSVNYVYKNAKRVVTYNKQTIQNNLSTLDSKNKKKENSIIQQVTENKTNQKSINQTTPTNEFKNLTTEPINKYDLLENSSTVVTSNIVKTNYQIQVKAASCRRNNGKVYLKANQAGIQFYWADLAISSESLENLKSGNYTILAKNENKIVDTLYVNVPDSGKTFADFKIYDIQIGNELVSVFENKSLIDKKNWKNQNGIAFSWNFGDGTSSNVAEPQHSFASSGTYQVSLTVTSKYGCRDSLTKSYIINIPQNFAELPNIFSPNSDGINDYFQPVFYDLQSIDCSIFSRSGELIYQWNTLNGKWDGKIRNTNQMASPGTYYYILKGITKQGKNIVHKGMVQLVL